MKNKILAFIAAVGLASSASAAVTLSGTALLNAPGLVAGQNAAYVIGVPGATLSPGPIGSGDTLDGLLGIGTNTASTVFTSTSLGAGANFDQTGLDGQQFSVIVFATSPLGQASVGDAYQVWTDPSWIVPAADGLYNFGTAFDQLSDAADVGGAVVPEPSTYAMLAGVLALVAVMIRRRK